jgi:hypothetical protein
VLAASVLATLPMLVVLHRRAALLRPGHLDHRPDGMITGPIG